VAGVGAGDVGFVGQAGEADGDGGDLGVLQPLVEDVADRADGALAAADQGGLDLLPGEAVQGLGVVDLGGRGVRGDGLLDAHAGDAELAQAGGVQDAPGVPADRSADARVMDQVQDGDRSADAIQFAIRAELGDDRGHVAGQGRVLVVHADGGVVDGAPAPFGEVPAVTCSTSRSVSAGRG
jgi:hypothetical protein